MSIMNVNQGSKYLLQDPTISNDWNSVLASLCPFTSNTFEARNFLIVLLRLALGICHLVIIYYKQASIYNNMNYHWPGTNFTVGCLSFFSHSTIMRIFTYFCHKQFDNGDNLSIKIVLYYKGVTVPQLDN